MHNILCFFIGLYVHLYLCILQMLWSKATYTGSWTHDPWHLLFKLLELFVKRFIVTANTK